MMLFLYNLLLPIGVLLFLPSIIMKLIRRPGYKKTYWERFGIFSKEKQKALRDVQGAIWIHSVSVGETMISLSMIEQWSKESPEQKFVLSTTTTTGQQLARDRAGDNTIVIFCPIDFYFFVRKLLRLLKPKKLIIFETEIWPTMITATKKAGGEVFLVNARMSDHSVKGYIRFRRFLKPILKNLTLIAAQTEDDANRFLRISEDLNVKTSGNMKFDQSIPQHLEGIDVSPYFGNGTSRILLAASTHPGEEELIVKTYIKLKETFSDLRLILVPRHAERASEIISILSTLNVSYAQRSKQKQSDVPVDVLLADTTGELLRFFKRATLVIMGKSLAGQNEGHNLIEPALLGKPIITGSVLLNFKFVLNTLKADNALALVDSDEQLEEVITRLLNSQEECNALGEKAKEAILKHCGATEKTIHWLNK
jgi:3-deoxy-D-manno-octulosonic-acid transferase